MTAFDEPPTWKRRLNSLKDDIGENPGRFLDRKISAPPARNSMFRARLEGIDQLETIGAWEAAERILAARDDREPRQHVLELLARRRRYLQEHGERPDRLDNHWPHELPERYNPATADRPDYDVEYYWWTGADREGERLEWSERPTSITVGSRPFGGPDRVATDGGSE